MCVYTVYILENQFIANNNGKLRISRKSLSLRLVSAYYAQTRKLVYSYRTTHENAIYSTVQWFSNCNVVPEELVGAPWDVLERDLESSKIAAPGRDILDCIRS